MSSPVNCTWAAACSWSPCGFVAQAGQHFDLLDWGGLTGSFDQIDSSGLLLAASTRLDLSALYTTGTVSVSAVPEPGTLALWLAGLLGRAGLGWAGLGWAGAAPAQSGRRADPALMPPSITS